MALSIRAHALPEPDCEFVFHKGRKWRFDFAWPGIKLALEYEGGQFGKSRHRSPMGYKRDCDKYNAAQMAGWVVLRVVRSHYDSGEWIELLKRALRRRGS